LTVSEEESHNCFESTPTKDYMESEIAPTIEASILKDPLKGHNVKLVDDTDSFHETINLRDK